MAENQLFLGIDLGYDRAMISMYQDGMADVSTISTAPGEDRYRIPTAIFHGVNDQYFYGEEALKREGNPDGDFFCDLLLHALEEEDVFYKKLLVQFIARIIRLSQRIDQSQMEEFVAIAIPEINETTVALFDYVKEELQYDDQHFFLMDYKESFYGHTLHQDQGIWMHDVAMFDFAEDTLSFALMHREGHGIQRVTCQTQKWEVPEHVMQNLSARDEYFANIIRETFNRKIISGVYFTGKGFDGNWLKESLRVIGQNKRVFLGQNLFTKGACYVAYRSVNSDGWPFYYDCDYKMQGEISLCMYRNGESIFEPVVLPGYNWFSTKKELRFFCDEDAILKTRIRVKGKPGARNEDCVLTDLPKRSPKSIRLVLEILPRGGRTVLFKVRDDGFGELFESTGKEWEFLIHI